LNKCSIEPLLIIIFAYKIPFYDRASANTPYGYGSQSDSNIGNLDNINNPLSVMKFEKKEGGLGIA
jgi:hypothetical protein